MSTYKHFRTVWEEVTDGRQLRNLNVSLAEAMPRNRPKASTLDLPGFEGSRVLWQGKRALKCSFPPPIGEKLAATAPPWSSRDRIARSRGEAAGMALPVLCLVPALTTFRFGNIMDPWLGRRSTRTSLGSGGRRSWRAAGRRGRQSRTVEGVRSCTAVPLLLGYQRIMSRENARAARLKRRQASAGLLRLRPAPNVNSAHRRRQDRERSVL